MLASHVAFCSIFVFWSFVLFGCLTMVLFGFPSRSERTEFDEQVVDQLREYLRLTFAERIRLYGRDASIPIRGPPDIIVGGTLNRNFRWWGREILTAWLALARK